MDHKETAIALRSLTHSIKAQRLLREYGIDARVIKPDAKKTERGCGYGVAVAVSDEMRARKILEENGIPAVGE